MLKTYSLLLRLLLLQLLLKYTWTQKKEAADASPNKAIITDIPSPPTYPAESSPPAEQLRPPATPFPPDFPGRPPPPPSPPKVYCPLLPPYPGISSVQILECDIEYPQPDICGLSLFREANLQLEPGQALAVAYINLHSPTALLSRLVLSSERLAFTLIALQQHYDPYGTYHPPEPALVFLISGFCTDISTLSVCLHNSYHAVPLYKACPGCFGVNVVSESAGGGGVAGNPQEEDEWLSDNGKSGGGSMIISGEATTVGDISYYRSQLPEGIDDGGGGVIYFLTSLSTHVVQLSYARAARVLYVPGARVAYLPPSNQSFTEIRPIESTNYNSSEGNSSSSSSSSSSSLRDNSSAAAEYTSPNTTTFMDIGTHNTGTERTDPLPGSATPYTTGATSTGQPPPPPLSGPSGLYAVTDNITSPISLPLPPPPQNSSSAGQRAVRWWCVVLACLLVRQYWG